MDEAVYIYTRSLTPPPHPTTTSPMAHRQSNGGIHKYTYPQCLYFIQT